MKVTITNNTLLDTIFRVLLTFIQNSEDGDGEEAKYEAINGDGDGEEYYSEAVDCGPPAAPATGSRGARLET